MAGLAAQATSFASDVEALLNGTVTESCSVAVFDLGDGTMTVAPADEDAPLKRLVPLSLSADRDVRFGAKLWLRIHYRVRMDDEEVHMAVANSSFGFCVNPGTAYCSLRVEYDRSANAQQSHVNVHGESASLAYAMSLTGRDYAPLSKLHIPMGGRRFRPTLEDFIEFLIQERLVVEYRKDWEDVLRHYRDGWEDRQVRATVRRAPAVAAVQLAKMGYEVTPP